MCCATAILRPPFLGLSCCQRPHLWLDTVEVAVFDPQEVDPTVAQQWSQGPLLYLGSPWHTREGVSYEPGTVRARSGQAIEATCHGVITLRSRPAVSSVLESKVKTKAPLGRPAQAGTAQGTGGWKQRTQKPWETREPQAGRNPGHSVATWVRATFQPTYLFQIGT